VAALLNLTHAAMAEQLPLAPEVSAALLHGAGRIGQVLRVVGAHENGELIDLAGGRNLAGEYMDAMRWSTRALQHTSLTAV
jgi:c-di-GMP-related signal transduction protein